MGSCGLLAVSLSAVVALSSFLLVEGEAAAQKHRLRSIRDGEMDLVMSVDWDFDQPGEGDRTYLREALRFGAKRVYEMTQGRLSLCKVYVFNKRKQWDLADIVASPTGRSFAPLGGIRTSYGQVNAFRNFANQPPRPAGRFGVTIAHELGHYALYLRDEYAEQKKVGEGEQDYLASRVCDVTLATTIMGGSAALGDLSVPADYTDPAYPAWTRPDGRPDESANSKYRSCELLRPPAPGAPRVENAQFRTPQWREYQLSAWELLVEGARAQRLAADARERPPIQRFPKITEGGMPRLPLREPTFDEKCHEPIFVDGTFALLLLDRSKSMDTKISDEVTYFKIAQIQAQGFVDSAPVGTTIGVMTFADDGRVELQPTKIEAENEAAQRQRIKAAIDGLRVDEISSTNIDRALIATKDFFLANPALGSTEYVVAISDGITEGAQQWQQLLRELRIPVFTQRIGFDPSRQLDFLADRTGGEYKSDSAWSYGAVKAVLDRRERATPRAVQSTGNAPLESTAFVSELDGSTRFVARIPPGAVGTFELRSPGGTVIAPGSLPPGATYEANADGAEFSIEKPAAGVWTQRFLPGAVFAGEVRFAVATDSALSVNLEMIGYQRYPDPFFVRTTLRAPNAVLGARVLGKLVKKQSNVAFELELEDDGVAPDETRGDGIYSAVFAKVTEDGEYTLTLAIDNPSTAQLAATDEGGTEAPKSLPPFARERTLELYAAGFRPMPQTFATAQQIRNDLTAVWGTINQPGEVVWYKFNGYANGVYAAMTGELISNDGTPMKTKLTLFERDGTTVIGTSEGEDGRAFVELKTLANEGDYFLKVEHATGGVGRFKIAVAPRDWFDRPQNSGSVDGSVGGDGCDCRTGPRAQSGGLFGLVLVVLPVLARLRRRTRLSSRDGDPAPAAVRRSLRSSRDEDGRFRRR